MFHEEFKSLDFSVVKRKLSDLRKSLEVSRNLQLNVHKVEKGSKVVQGNQSKAFFKTQATIASTCAEVTCSQSPSSQSPTKPKISVYEVQPAESSSSPRLPSCAYQIPSQQQQPLNLHILAPSSSSRSCSSVSAPSKDSSPQCTNKLLNQSEFSSPAPAGQHCLLPVANAPSDGGSGSLVSSSIASQHHSLGSSVLTATLLGPNLPPQQAMVPKPIEQHSVHASSMGNKDINGEGTGYLYSRAFELVQQPVAPLIQMPCVATPIISNPVYDQSMFAERQPDVSSYQESPLKGGNIFTQIPVVVAASSSLHSQLVNSQPVAGPSCLQATYIPVASDQCSNSNRR